MSYALFSFMRAWLYDDAPIAAMVGSFPRKANYEAEFEKYRVIQDKNFSSDFDRFIGDSSLSLDFAPEDE